MFFEFPSAGPDPGPFLVYSRSILNHFNVFQFKANNLTCEKGLMSFVCDIERMNKRRLLLWGVGVEKTYECWGGVIYIVPETKCSE